jgi:hypothetical protein
VLLQAWKVVLPCDEARPSSHGRSPGIAIPGDMRDIDQRTAKDRSVSLHACHVALPDDDAHASSLRTSILQAWKVDLPMDDGSSSKHGRSPLHAWQVTGRDDEHHPSTLGGSGGPRSGSGRIVSVTGMDTLGLRTWSLPWWAASHAGRASKARYPNSEDSPPRQRGFDARATKAGGPRGKARCPADRRCDFRSSKPESHGHATRIPAIASVTARQRRLLPELRRDRSQASSRRRPPTKARSPPSTRSSCESAFSIAGDGDLVGPSGTRSGAWRASRDYGSTRRRTGIEAGGSGHASLQVRNAW